jgi:hypothetical protein
MNDALQAVLLLVLLTAVVAAIVLRDMKDLPPVTGH